MSACGFSAKTVQIEIIGEDNFAVTRAYWMQCANDKTMTNGPIVLPDGSVRAWTTDGGSIPEAANVVVGDRMKYFRTYAMHDLAYRRRTWDDGTPMTREDADTLILHDGLETEGADLAERDMIVAAVRMFGVVVWDSELPADLNNPSDTDFWTIVPGRK